MITKLIIENDDKETELCHLMKKHNSDKCFGRHYYTLIYDKLFSNIRYNYNNIFELGLGTNNPNIPSTMGINANPGASLKAWKEFFPKSNIYGADIDKDILFKEDRIQTYYVDQLNESIIHSMWNSYFNDIIFDIMIDDGLHTLEGNICFLKNSFKKLKNGGIYIIEDVIINDLDRYKIELNKLNLNYDILIVDDTFGSGRKLNDGCLIFIKKQLTN